MPAPTQPQRVLLGLPSSLLFPHDVSTVDVRRPENVRALSAMELDTQVLVGALKSPEASLEERFELVLPIATLARLVSRTHLQGGGMRIVLKGVRRARVEALTLEDGCLWALPGPAPALDGDPARAQRGLARLLAALDELSASAPEEFGEVAEVLPLYGSDVDRITDLLAANLSMDYATEAQLLGELDPAKRLEQLNRVLEGELARVRAELRLDERMARRDRRELLRRRIEAMRAELGELSPHEQEYERLATLLASTPLPKAVREDLTRELELFQRTTSDNAAAGRIQGHLEWALGLPWEEPSTPADPRPFDEVGAILSDSHVGLDDVKQRIAEILAIRQLGGGARGTAICFVGPPGTGKSSMARAVAAALGREFLTIPVGAKTQERELAGLSRHREGGGPGAILAGIHRVGSRDPVILLDEIDKLSLGGEGTAAGALLLVLDPEHNTEFFDHYLGAPFDLSGCLFIATANDIEEIPETLLDRMELIAFQGYTEAEKYRIARRHLLPRARQHAGIDAGALRISPGALRDLIRGWTEEAGVRSLQRHLIALGRKAAVDVVRGGDGLKVRKADLGKLLGPRTVGEETRMGRPGVGVATGLAWTSVGGSLLPLEALAMAGSGRVILTGSLGEVIRESVQTVLSYVRTTISAHGLEPSLFDEVDLHLHFPSAGTPKDGPSAGIAIAVALVSLLTNRPVRHDVALTGEMSLLGAVLPVGGLREKILAAGRCAIREVIVPALNAEDLDGLPEEIRGSVTIHTVSHVQEVLELALLPERGPRRSVRGGESAPRPIARRARRGARRRASEGGSA
ncbi:MAG TPA: AAA family ATPase [Planctomycetes bacterium]|nr:AAA family ATPase [Planctomycetota bacterium]